MEYSIYGMNYYILAQAHEEEASPGSNSYFSTITLI